MRWRGDGIGDYADLHDTNSQPSAERNVNTEYCNSRGRGLVTSSRSIDPGIASVLQSKTCHSADVTLMSDNDATYSSRTSFGDRFAARLVVVERNELRCTTGVHFSQNGEEAHLKCAIAKALAGVSYKDDSQRSRFALLRPPLYQGECVAKDIFR